MFLMYVVWSVFTVYRHKCPKYFRLAFFGTFQLLSSRGLSKLNTFLFRLATTSIGRRDNSTGKGIKSYIGLATRRKKLTRLPLIGHFYNDWFYCYFQSPFYFRRK